MYFILWVVIIHYINCAIVKSSILLSLEDFTIIDKVMEHYEMDSMEAETHRYKYITTVYDDVDAD